MYYRSMESNSFKTMRAHSCIRNDAILNSGCHVTVVGQRENISSIVPTCKAGFNVVFRVVGGSRYRFIL